MHYSFESDCNHGCHISNTITNHIPDVTITVKMAITIAGDTTSKILA